MELIKGWDTNNDGKVDKDEFHKAVKRMGLHFPDDVVESLFLSLGGDSTGEIPVEDLITALKRIRPRRDTAIRLKISKAKADAAPEATKKVGFEGPFYKKPFNRGFPSFGVRSQRDKYTSW